MHAHVIQNCVAFAYNTNYMREKEREKEYGQMWNCWIGVCMLCMLKLGHLYCCFVVLLFRCIAFCGIHSHSLSLTLTIFHFSFWIIYHSVSLVCFCEYFIAIFVFHFQTKFDFKWMRFKLLPDQQLFVFYHIQNLFEFISIEQIKSLMSQNSWPNVCWAFNSFSLI